MYHMTVIDFTDIPLETIKLFNSKRSEYKQVSDEVIERMYKDCKLNLGRDVDVVKPEDFNLHEYSEKIVQSLEGYNKIVVIGDIHS